MHADCPTACEKVPGAHTTRAHKNTDTTTQTHTQPHTNTHTTARFCIHTAAPQQAQRRLVHVDALELDEYMPTGQAARKRNAITSQPASQQLAAHAREQAPGDEAKYPTPQVKADGAAVGAADEHAAAPLLDESPAAHSVAQLTQSTQKTSQLRIQQSHLARSRARVSA